MWTKWIAVAVLGTAGLGAGAFPGFAGYRPNGTVAAERKAASVILIPGQGQGGIYGDPHLTTVSGVHYDFQAAGDFVALRSSDGMVIQTRLSPVATTFTPGPDPYDGLAASNVTLNTAIAARVGTHRVTYQPNVSGVPDPTGLQLRIDGVVTSPSASGINLGGGARVARAPTGPGIQVDFSNGSVLQVTPAWWASEGKWYLDVHVFQTSATEGIMGALAPGSWLPALPDGTSMGPMPHGGLHRIHDLYQRFADAWRVTDGASLFDYPDASTAHCDLAAWPQERPACVVPQKPPARAVPAPVARALCAPLEERNAVSDCAYDVTATGDRGFAASYLLARRLRLGSTVTRLTGEGNSPTFAATVTRLATGEAVPGGAVQFTIDGQRAGQPVPLDAGGHAVWRAARLPGGTHRVDATYVPSRGSVVFPSGGSLDWPQAIADRR